MIALTKEDLVIDSPVKALPEPRAAEPRTPRGNVADTQTRQSPASERARNRRTNASAGGSGLLTTLVGPEGQHHPESRIRPVHRPRLAAEAGPAVPPWMRRGSDLKTQALLVHARLALFR